MKKRRVKQLILNVVKTLPLFFCTLVVLLVMKTFITGEKSYYLQFTYPLGELREILSEIDKTGKTFVKQLNNITEQYSLRHDPSVAFCESSCSSKEFDMVFIIKSFVGNFGQRTAIRKTWGGVNNLNIKTLFVVGYLEVMQEFVEIESQTNLDIIQFDMTDNYVNLVYKTIFSIAWLADRNINTKYVHLLDDDRMVNTKNLYNFAFKSLSTTEMQMIGYKVTFGTPFRSRSSKWFMTLDEYPFDLWPPYLIGGTILTNMHVVKKIAMAFPYVKILKMEDTFIGIIAKLLNIKVEHNKGFLPDYVPGSELKDKLSCPDYRTYHALIKGWAQLQ